MRTISQNSLDILLNNKRRRFTKNWVLLDLKKVWKNLNLSSKFLLYENIWKKKRQSLNERR